MALGSDRDVAKLAIGLLDLTDLGDDTSADAVEDLCTRAKEHRVAAVCVWPMYVAMCADLLADSGVHVATVANFPSGDEPVRDVVEMTRLALDDGADEVDVVLPYHAWLHGDTDTAARMLHGVRDLVNEYADVAAGPGILKVIIESGELPDRAAIDRATHFAIEHGADFVKTSTGKTNESATIEAAEVILEAIEMSGLPVGFKPSGGIRTLADARRYLEAAEDVMGPGWISRETFRFGASALLDDLAAIAGT